MIQNIQQIEDRRIQLGIPARSLAKAAGIAPSTYSRLREGITQPMVKTLEALCDALDLFEDSERRLNEHN